MLQNKTEQLKQKVHQRRDIDFKVPGLSLFHFSFGWVFPLTQSKYDSEEIRLHNEYMVVIIQNDVSTHIGPLGVHSRRYYFDKLPYSRISHQHINSNITYLCYPKFENEKNNISNTHICFELDDILLFPLHLSRFRYLNYRGLVSVLPEKKPEASERALVSEGNFQGTEVSWR